MAGVSQEFGEAVRTVLEKRAWSHLRANVATGIPSATVGRMALGIVPGSDHIVAWATALKEPINHWLQLAGYDPIPPELVSKTPAGYHIVESSDGLPVCLPTDLELDQAYLWASSTV